MGALKKNVGDNTKNVGEKRKKVARFLKNVGENRTACEGCESKKCKTPGDARACHARGGLVKTQKCHDLLGLSHSIFPPEFS